MGLLTIYGLLINPTPAPHSGGYGLIALLISALLWALQKSYPFMKSVFYRIINKKEDFL
jgi:hypothetical protein